MKHRIMGAEYIKLPPLRKLKMYQDELPSYGDLMTVEKFRICVDAGTFMDYDGYGHPVKDNKSSRYEVRPSKIHLIPKDATHIIWFNR